VWGFGDAREESLRFAACFAVIAEDRGVPFFDAGSVAAVSPLDGVHLDADAHRAIGTALAPLVRETLGDRLSPSQPLARAFRPNR
jgi:hypothetical protein